MIKRNKLCWLIILLFILLASMNNQGTYSWFTSEISANGGITNATTDRLIEIGEPEVRYEDDGIVWIHIPVTNIAELSIPITVDNVERIVRPEETVIFTIAKKVTVESNIPIEVIGFNKYIDEQIVVQLESTKLTSSAAITW